MLLDRDRSQISRNDKWHMSVSTECPGPACVHLVSDNIIICLYYHVLILYIQTLKHCNYLESDIFQLPSSFPSALLSSEVLQPPINLENNNSVRTVVQCTVYSVQCTCVPAVYSLLYRRQLHNTPGLSQWAAVSRAAWCRYRWHPDIARARHVSGHLDSPRSEPGI